MKSMKFLLAILIITLPLSGFAKNCGKIKGHKIVTYGGLSCVKAKHIYRTFQSGHIPKGWTCGESVGGCGKGKMGFTFKLN